MISLYDAHNHLQDERLTARLEEIVRDHPAACVVNASSERDWAHVEQLAKRHTWVVPAFGLHPWYAKERSARWFDELRRYLDANPRATIGEIGLDRWIRDADVADQERVFAQQLELAAERNVAASIHCLKAWGHLEEALHKSPRPERGFLIHSYGGSAEMVPVFSKLGAYFSISGYYAHERKAAQREAFKRVALGRILVETDAPDMLPPQGLVAYEFGEANDPRNLGRIYEFAAGLFGLTVDAFAERVKANFTSLFL